MTDCADANLNVIKRGGTVYFQATFFNPECQPVNPDGATINLLYTPVGEPGCGEPTAVEVAMTPPGSGSFVWTAFWDSRGAQPGNIPYSLHTTNSILPVGVFDGSFILEANAANLPTF